MAKHQRKVRAKLKKRQENYDTARNKQGRVKPGSQNLKKQ